MSFMNGNVNVDMCRVIVTERRRRKRKGLRMVATKDTFGNWTLTLPQPIHHKECLQALIILFDPHHMADDTVLFEATTPHVLFFLHIQKDNFSGSVVRIRNIVVFYSTSISATVRLNAKFP